MLDDPDLITFATIDDLPTDLVWEDGSDLPDIGSPNATKGGTMYGALADFPRTLRLFGPDSNGSFRPWILDDTRMGLANRHPNDTSIDANGNFRYFPGVAEAWAVDTQKATVYIRLNPAARFSDGEPVTTDDMMFTLEEVRCIGCCGLAPVLTVNDTDLFLLAVQLHSEPSKSCACRFRIC